MNSVKLSSAAKNMSDFVPQEFLLAALQGKIVEEDYLALASDGLLSHQRRESIRQELDDHVDPVETKGLKKKISSLLPLKRAHKQGSFSFKDLSMLAKPGYLELEHGYTFINNKNVFSSDSAGMWFVAILTDMGEVTGEMFKWWVNHCDDNSKFVWSHPYANKSCVWDTSFYAVQPKDRVTVRMDGSVLGKDLATVIEADDETNDDSKPEDHPVDSFVGQKTYCVLNLSAAAKDTTSQDGDGNLVVETDEDDLEAGIAAAAAAATRVTSDKQFSFANQVLDADVIISAGAQNMVYEYLDPRDYISQDELLNSGVTACIIKKMYRLVYASSDSAHSTNHRIASTGKNLADKITLASLSVPKIVHVGHMVQMMRRTRRGRNELRTRIWINSDHGIETSVADARVVTAEDKDKDNDNDTASETSKQAQTQSQGGIPSLYNMICSFFDVSDENSNVDSNDEAQGQDDLAKYNAGSDAEFGAVVPAYEEELPEDASGDQARARTASQSSARSVTLVDGEVPGGGSSFLGMSCVPVKRSDLKKLIMNLNNNIAYVLLSHHNEENIAVRSFLPKYYDHSRGTKGETKAEGPRRLTTVGSLLAGSLYEDSSEEEEDDVDGEFNLDLDLATAKKKKNARKKEEKAKSAVVAEKLSIAELQAQKESIKQAETKSRFVQQYLAHKEAEKTKKVPVAVVGSSVSTTVPTAAVSGPIEAPAATSTDLAVVGDATADLGGADNTSSGDADPRPTLVSAMSGLLKGRASGSSKTDIGGSAWPEPAAPAPVESPAVISDSSDSVNITADDSALALVGDSVADLGGGGGAAPVPADSAADSAVSESQIMLTEDSEEVL